MTNKNYSEEGLEILVTIVNKEKADYYTDVLQSFEVNLQMVTLAQGTASPEKMSTLDFSEPDKAVILSIIRKDQVKYAKRSLEEKFKSRKNGNGIAFAIPMSSIIGVSVFGFLSNNEKMIKEE